MTTPLESLVAYYEPLSALTRDLHGSMTLQTRATPLLGANASYLLPGAHPDVVPLLRVWHESQGSHPLFASLHPIPGAEHVQTLRVGTYSPVPESGVIVVEQLSRLHMARFAALLSEAHELADWAAPLGKSLASSLERLPSATLLMAYAGSEEIGALLHLPGAAHLWATLDPAADAPLLNRAAELSGGEVWTSLPDSSPLTVQNGAEVIFSLLKTD
ncbi:hypothetical protein MF271_04685 [Deinococcus sp. KNUC1210]|uniref:hypothetical protein n=1 Tax=Deinococcus sp. KNUC1210 TaxID=2917691 RepID=UPI001EF15FD8|nr:hypothetical protein [Deinococcus sp. KNUC1210]ULH15931.1 hypothetical protein MF271_04685 [Deinococcus sp. KNUC1210]